MTHIFCKVPLCRTTSQLFLIPAHFIWTSLLIRHDDRENESTASIGSVHVLTPQNEYFYRPRNLLIAYCSAIVATSLVVLVGLYCISAAHSKTFDTSFSTVLRTTRSPELGTVVPSSQSSGEMPLSKNLARTRLKLLDNVCGTGDKKNRNAVCGAGLRTSFMVVNHAGSLDQCSEVVAQSDLDQSGMSMTDVDSLLIPDEESYSSVYADTSTLKVDDSSATSARNERHLHE